MGTRNLTCVVKDGEFKVAQYGQWDGYPSGQGATILEYFKRFSIEDLERGLVNCYWISEEDIDEIFKELGLPENGWLNTEQAEQFSTAYPSLSRDTGANILELITVAGKNGETVPLTDAHQFAANSLFCEFAYVIDLDNHTLEVYTGFNSTVDNPPGRFGSLSIGEEDKARELMIHGYYYRPVVLTAVYSLNDLPTVAEMEAAADRKETA